MVWASGMAKLYELFVKHWLYQFHRTTEIGLHGESKTTGESASNPLYRSLAQYLQPSHRLHPFEYDSVLIDQARCQELGELIQVTYVATEFCCPFNKCRRILARLVECRSNPSSILSGRRCFFVDNNPSHSLL